jgi:uncharacterized membrane protein YphA (DoxX/SURF4 family)
MKAVRRSLAVILGLVFLVAGLLKLMDPVGAGLVAAEYFNFLHLGFLAPVAKLAGVLMALVETIVGIALITGLMPRATAVFSGLLIVVFTVLTFILWRLNPPMECGCFGEAIHLTHFQTFVKNLVLCALWVITFIPMSSLQRPRKIKYVSSAIAIISVILFAVYSMMSIPAMDFTSFAPGATLMQAEVNPSPESPLLSICDGRGDYCDEILADGAILLITVYDPEKTPDASLERMTECMKQAGEAGLKPLLIASGEYSAAAYTSDRRSLMAVNRSNGGATLLRDGMVVAKWPLRSLPDADNLKALMDLDPAEAMVKENTPKRLKLQGFLLYVFAVLLLL